MLSTVLTRYWYNPTYWNREIENIRSKDVSLGAKRVQFLQLQKTFSSHGFPHDSVYAHLLHRIGSCYSADSNYKEAIAFAQQAISINQSGWPWCSPSFACKTYRNLGLYYEAIKNTTLALQSFDSAIAIADRYMTDSGEHFFYASMFASNILVEEGDFEGALRIAENALHHIDAAGTESTDYIAFLYSSASQSAIELGQIEKAQKYLNSFLLRYNPQPDTDFWYDYKTQQFYLAVEARNWLDGRQLLQQMIDTARSHRNDPAVKRILIQQALYYRRIGQPENAEKVYFEVEKLQRKSHATAVDFTRLYNNLGHTLSMLHNHQKALQWFQKSLGMQMGIQEEIPLLQYPAFSRIVARPGKQMTFICIRNKSEALLQCYRKTGDTAYLNASAHGFLLADSLFTNMRQTQTGEESKIYWRKNGHSFYQQALEMCVEKKDFALAYYYMEKSRAALLLDHLNELGASAHLSETDSRKEEALKLDVLDKKLQFGKLSYTSPAFETVQQQLHQAEERQRVFIRSLESAYPDYYRYKYASDITPIDSLQAYLRKNKQQWVQYLLNDSLLFVLYADGRQLKLQRKVVKTMEQQTLPEFIRHCADVQYQRNDYNHFIQTSAHIYDTLLRGVPVHPGRLIISPDNAIIPFDALCTNLSSRRWAVQDYAISYAYSAGFLLKAATTNSNETAQGDFLGIAPIHFPVSYKLAPLSASGNAITQLKDCFSAARVVTSYQATSYTFLQQLPQYRIVAVYTHARSSNSDTSEPKLFLADRPVQLSELSRIQKPATQLVMLSACQTNTGREVIGEGVFSIARGFAMAGIPATVATLWSADETATYATTEKLCKSLAQGRSKDEALQGAKLQIMMEDGMSLPFYWANMTLTGNADATHLQPANSSSKYSWFIIGATVIIAMSSCWWLKRKNAVTQLKDIE